MFKLAVILVVLGVAAAGPNYFKCARLSKTDCSKFPEKPVCGSDGKNSTTFTNGCFLEKAECELKKTLRVFRGDCENKPTMPPMLDRCSQEYMNKYVVCKEGSKAICGSDGKTYTNKCEFHKARCADIAKLGKKDAPKVYIKAYRSCEDLPTRGPRPTRADYCKTYWLKQDCSKQRSNAFTKMCDREQNVYANRCEFYQAYCKDNTIRATFCRRPRPTKPSGSGEEPQF